MKITEILNQINMENNLKVKQAKNRDELANIIHEDYFISWLSAFCIAGVFFKNLKTRTN